MGLCPVDLSVGIKGAIGYPLRCRYCGGFMCFGAQRETQVEMQLAAPDR